jgi:hypothetical protein
LTTAGVEPIVPASPAPFNPIGLVVDITGLEGDRGEIVDRRAAGNGAMLEGAGAEGGRHVFG